MSSSSIPSRKLGYASRRANSKQKEQGNKQLVGMQAAREILGNEPGYDLYANMNNDNLNYIKDQIKQKKKKLNHQRAKSSVPQVQTETYHAVVQRNTHRDASCDKEDRISQTDAYQEETQRQSHQKQLFQQKISGQLSSKGFRDDREEEDSAEVQRSSQSEQQFSTEDRFLNNLNDYIYKLQERPTRPKSTSIHIRKTPVAKVVGGKQNSIEAQYAKPKFNHSKYEQLQKKYKQQKQQNGILAREIEKQKKFADAQQSIIARLKQQIYNLSRENERYFNLLDYRNYERYVLNSRKNDTFEQISSPKMMWRREPEFSYHNRQDSQSIQKLQEQYRQFTLKNDIRQIPSYRK